MSSLDRTPALDRSPVSPRSGRRLALGMAIACLGPLLVTPASVEWFTRLPAIPYYVVIAVAAWFGRLTAGILATVVSALMLVVFAFPPVHTLILRSDDVVAVVSFFGLSALVAIAISFERASAARVALAQRRLQLLADVTRILKTDLDSRAALQRLAERVVPELADWCAIHVVEDGAVVVAAVAHPDPARIALARRLQEEYPDDLEAPGGVGEVLRTGTHVHIAEITDDMIRAGARDEEHLEVLRSLGIRSAIVAPLTARGETFGAITLIVAEGDWRYDEEDLAFVLDLAMRTATIVDTVKAYELEHATLERNRVVQAFAEALSKTTTLDEVFEVVIRDAIAVLGADRSLIALVNENRRDLRIVEEVGHHEGVRARWATFPLDADLPISEAVREHRAVVVGSLAELYARYPAVAAEPMDEQTLVCLPLVAEGEEIGGVSLGYPAGRTFSPRDLAFLSTIFSQAAQAVRRALLFEERDRTARVLQAALLPRELPRIAGVSFAAGYWAAGRAAEVGGDFYDVLETDDGFLALVGDVCGRGPEAAAIMGVARTTTRILASREPSLTRLFAQVNAALLDEMGTDGTTFVTLCGVAARRRPSEPAFDLEVVCAGHPHPVLFGRGVARGIGENGLVLGVMPEPHLVASTEVLGPGEGLILYTDGLAERGRGHVRVEEDDQLLTAIDSIGMRGPEAFVTAVSDLVSGGSAIEDDTAVLVLRVD